MGLAKETALIRIAVYIVIPTLQRVLRALLDVAQHVTDKLDDLGFVLAKKLVSPDR
jgi:ABC-type proline/glycine betaine transport system permease subunit